MTNNKPETLRDGNLKASIWRNEGENGPYFTVTLAKTYKDKNGDLQDTNSFSIDDLPRLNLLLEDTYRDARDMRREQYRSSERDNNDRSQSRGGAARDFERENNRSRARGRSYSR